MCDPVSITTGLLTAGSALTGYQAQNAQAKAQNAASQMQRQNTLTSLQDSYKSTQKRMAQEQKTAALQIDQKQKAKRQALATAEVSAAEAGVGGYSVDALMRQISGLGATDIATITEQRDWNIANLSDQMSQQKQQADAVLSSQAKVSGASPLAALLQIGQGTLSSYDSYLTRHATTTQKG